ncbi:DUF2637 domain-containing protein [Micromonospora peucetia]|uniref:DUF2637 domain-containing protein n=1 Tax=Micromonospora peucetia TaxID=47871 RepID=A0ABZ1EJ82_9ACTN|nr:DUF2637 domain-containing protein [Micromonospora peucetia]WSA34308.1 DUF2637 domain-containing protein [Micromonospora peucetia]
MTATPQPPQNSARTPQEADIEPRNLTRLRWAVRAVLTLGVAASIAANVLHARPNLISQIIAAWPPLALLLTVELISRVPADRRGLAAARLIAAGVIAGIAAWVSYWHMVGVAARYGETSAAASYLLPISVDGLVVVASISLVEIAGRIRAPSVSPVYGQQPAAKPSETQSPTAESPNQETPTHSSGPIRAAQLAQDYVVSPMPRPEAAISADQGDYPATDVPAPALAGASSTERVAPKSPRIEARDRKDAHVVPTGNEAPAPRDTTPLWGKDPARLDADRPGTSRSRTPGSSDTPLENSAERDGADPLADAGDAELGTIGDQGHTLDPHDGRNSAEVPPDSAGAVAYWYRQDPSLHPAEIATRIGRSERTVRRYWPPVPRTTNGHDASRATEEIGAS